MQLNDPINLLHPSGPCQNGGVCIFTDVEGAFFCNCPSGYTGDRCQYTDVCINQNPCPPDQSCVTTITTAEGYICTVLSANDTIIITDPAASLSTLDDQVNTLLETQDVRFFVDLNKIW